MGTTSAGPIFVLTHTPPRDESDPVYTFLSGDVRDEPCRGLIVFDLLYAKLRRAPDSREERCHDDRADEEGGDLNSVRSLDDVSHQRIEKDQGNESETDAFGHAFFPNRECHRKTG